MATNVRAPTSDEAASGTLSGSAGTRYTLVDDYPDTTPNDILTFGTATAIITFGFSAFAIPAGSTGISVQVMYRDDEASSGTNNCGGRLKVGGSYYNASTHNPSTTATNRSDNFATNPKTTVAWTVDDINGVGANALQAFGINSTDSNPTFFITGIQLQVTFTRNLTDALRAGVSSFAGNLSRLWESIRGYTGIVEFAGDLSYEVIEGIGNFVYTASGVISHVGGAIRSSILERLYSGAINIAGTLIRSLQSERLIGGGGQSFSGELAGKQRMHEKEIKKNPAKHYFADPESKMMDN